MSKILTIITAPAFLISIAILNLIFAQSTFSYTVSILLIIEATTFIILNAIDLNVPMTIAPKHARGFKAIDEKNRKGIKKAILPTRGSKNAMAYDFYSDADYVVAPNGIVKIWTNIKAYMLPDECLILNVRSSMGGKWQLANTQGWIDSDYYENKDNDGNIGIFLKNISDEVLNIKSGDRIAQGAFFKYLVADNCNTDEERTGGFGSTGK